jgi:hypothetical protein
VASDSRARIFLFGVSRSYAFRGLDVVPYQPLEAPPTLAWLHESADVLSLHCRLRGMHVSHVFADFQNLHKASSRPAELADYGAAEYRADIQRVVDLMDERARTIYRKGGIRIADLRSSGRARNARLALSTGMTRDDRRGFADLPRAPSSREFCSACLAFGLVGCLVVWPRSRGRRVHQLDMPTIWRAGSAPCSTRGEVEGSPVLPGCW